MRNPVVNIADIELPPRPASNAARGGAAQRFDARMGESAGSAVDYWDGE